MRKAKVYMALLHYPMYNKQKDIITTSITNLDLHDMARVAKTYDLNGFFIVHPAENQHSLIKEIVAYWQEGYGGTYNPDRKEAFDLLNVAKTLDEVEKSIESETNQIPIKIATDAKVHTNTVTYQELKHKIFHHEEAILLLFGTGWGIAEEVMSNCAYILEPIERARTYNHLSVRSAVSIIIDRLLGEYWYNT